MTPDDFREGVLRIFPCELPQQIQIASHSFESISLPQCKIRQKLLIAVRKRLYFRCFIAQFECTMTRRFFSLFVLALAFLPVAQNSLRAEATNAALANAVVLENEVAYLRVGNAAKNLADEIGAELHALDATNKIVGTVLDLRFADSDDFGAAHAAANLFAAKQLPLAILVNGETRGAAVALASELQAAREGLIFGSATPSAKYADGEISRVQPDITITVSSDDELAFLKNPYGTLSQGETNSSAGTNDFSQFIDHTSEADLVRAKIKDGDEDGDSTPPRTAEPQKPFIRDPVLARAVDLIEGLAVMRQSHS